MNKRTTSKRKRFTTFVRRAASVRESSVLLFGSPNDPEVRESKRRAELTRKTEIAPRPNFDTGIGPCGKHVCSCKNVCKEEYAQAVAFPGDKGANMGMCY